MKQRPKCVRCGKSYGNRATNTVRVTWPANEMPQRPQNNLQLVKYDSWNSGQRDGVDVKQHLFVFWDGESFRGLKYKPFCSQACTLAYARDMYARHS